MIRQYHYSIVIEPREEAELQEGDVSIAIIMTARGIGGWGQRDENIKPTLD
jgi:hypothetical protein